MRVVHPQHPEWGVGQVQSVVGNRVTVNFEHAGKLLLNLGVVALEQVEA
jgi:transcription elongation factor GreA-like protein